MQFLYYICGSSCCYLLWSTCTCELTQELMVDLHSLLSVLVLLLPSVVAPSWEVLILNICYYKCTYGWCVTRQGL